MACDDYWDYETDVIVVGYGLAGAVAAIEAHDTRAEVVILEKSQYAGGLSILSGGMILCARNTEDAIDYMTATSGGRVDKRLICAFARDLVKNEEYLRKLADPYHAVVRTTEANIALGYPFKGNYTFYRAGVTSVPGFRGFSWVQRLSSAAVNLMKILFDSVHDRSVTVMLSTAAERLLDVEGEVVGVIANRDGKKLKLKARRAVILSCGGFEQDSWLLKQYLQGMPFYSVAPSTYTGDGIRMAQKVGASLWHMWHIHGSYGYKFEEFPIAFRTPFAGSRNPNRIMPWIVVDRFGVRYMNEYQPAPQDTAHRAMEIFDPDMPGYPRIPSYIIFDEAGRKHGPIAKPISIGGNIYTWSQDNEKEITKGWILQASSVSELALKIRETSENETKMDPKILESSILQWNNTVKMAKDYLQRPPGTMMEIEFPPFYAVPVWPIINNTQGGPQHDARQQILDAFSEPVPRLYAAGELGSFWSHLYLLSGNLGECLSSGRIAGKNSAMESTRNTAHHA